MRPEPNIGTSGSQRSSNVLNPPIKINSPNRFVTMHLTHDNSGFAFRFSPRFDKIVEMLIPARQTVINFWKLRPPIEPVESHRSPLEAIPDVTPFHYEIVTALTSLSVDDVLLSVPPYYG